MYNIGIIGFSGSGKSTFSSYLKELGAYIIDADKIGREIMEKGKPALEEVREKFGDCYILPDGNLDRKKLGKLVFNNKEKLDLLNSITFKRIEEEIDKRLLGEEEIKVVDCALLNKMKIIKKMNIVIFIDAPEEILAERIVKRDNITYEDAVERINSQKEDLKSASDVIIFNNKDKDILKSKAKEIMERI